MMFEPLPPVSGGTFRPMTTAWIDYEGKRYYIGSSTCRCQAIGTLTETTHYIRAALRKTGSREETPSFTKIFRQSPWYLRLSINPSDAGYSAEHWKMYMDGAELAAKQALRIFKAMVCKEDYYWFKKRLKIDEYKSFADCMMASNCVPSTADASIRECKKSSGVSFSSSPCSAPNVHTIRISNQTFSIVLPTSTAPSIYTVLKDNEESRTWLGTIETLYGIGLNSTFWPRICTVRMNPLAEDSPVSLYILYGLWRNIFLLLLTTYGPLWATYACTPSHPPKFNAEALSAKLCSRDYRTMLHELVQRNRDYYLGETNFHRTLNMDRTGFCFTEYTRLLSQGLVYSGISTPSRLESLLPHLAVGSLEDFREGFTRRKYPPFEHKVLNSKKVRQ